ncbi:MAG: single-stranded-DNA-specific exonuclease RecJ [Candidatus Omnitrophota bacterium]|jgi:single-stranded-DNA-specific exonuclease
MSQTILTKQWHVMDPDWDKQAWFSRELGIDPVIAQLLVNRGIESLEEAARFFSPGLDKIHDPFLLKDIDKTLSRISLARQKGERVLIFGDYDVDGITSTAVLYNYLHTLGIDVVTHLPHRIHDGYGLNENVCQIAREKGASLVIAVDCGITAFREIELLQQEGLDCLVIDHHEPAERGIPSAFAVIDPKRKDCPYPFKHLAAVGLVAKLGQALFGAVQEEYLDLIALGTIADVVPLRDENRIFVKMGLPRIGQTKNKGLSALMEVARIRGKKMKPYHAGFILGPRINATGRMGSAQQSLDLLLSEDHNEAQILAQSLENLNNERQKLQRDVVQEALSLVEREVNFQDHKIIVVSKEGWHKGVLGIVASRLAEMYYRPTIVISLQDGVGTASARSIAGFHLHEALEACSEMLENFGGHKLAAGLTILEPNIEKFTRSINEFAHRYISTRCLVPALDIDQELPLSSLNLCFLETIDRLEPYGEGNPEPLFCSRNLRVKSQPVVLGRETLKFWVTDGDVTVSAVGFGLAKYRDMVRFGTQIDLAYQPIIDDWNKTPVVQLKIKDLKMSA